MVVVIAGTCVRNKAAARGGRRLILSSIQQIHAIVRLWRKQLGRNDGFPWCLAIVKVLHMVVVGGGTMANSWHRHHDGIYPWNKHLSYSTSILWNLSPPP